MFENRSRQAVVVFQNHKRVQTSFFFALGIVSCSVNVYIKGVWKCNNWSSMGERRQSSSSRESKSEAGQKNIAAKLCVVLCSVNVYVEGVWMRLESIEQSLCCIEYLGVVEKHRVETCHQACTQKVYHFFNFFVKQKSNDLIFVCFRFAFCVITQPVYYIYNHFSSAHAQLAEFVLC